MEQAGGETTSLLGPRVVLYMMKICVTLWLSSRLWVMFVFFPIGSKEDTTALHVLGLLKELMGTFPLGAVKSCCETLLRVMTLSHVVRTQKYS